MKYKMRAECSADAQQFYERIHSHLTFFKVIRPNALPDVIITFETKLTPHDLLSNIEKIADGHVMLETLQYSNNYTGERSNTFYQFIKLNEVQ